MSWPWALSDTAPDLSGVLAQDARQLLGDDLIFARLQHERAHDESGPAFAAADDNGRFGIPQQLRSLPWLQRDSGIPRDAHMRHMIRNIRNEEGSANTRHFG